MYSVDAIFWTLWGGGGGVAVHPHDNLNKIFLFN